MSGVFLVAVVNTRPRREWFFNLVTLLVQWLHRRKRYNVVHVEIGQGMDSIGAWNPEGVKKRDLDAVVKRFDSPGRTVMIVPARPEFDKQCGEAWWRAHNDIGKPYDMKAAINAGLDWFERLHIGRAFNDPLRAFCSQVTARAFDDEEPAEWTPAQEAVRPTWSWKLAIPAILWIQYQKRNYGYGLSAKAQAAIKTRG